jgi:hypothetical protein
MIWQPSRLDAVRTCMLLRCSRPSQVWQLSLGVQRRAGRSTRAFRWQHPRCELPDQAQPKSILDTVARPGVLRQTLVSRNTEQGIQAKYRIQFVVGTSLILFAGAASLTNRDTGRWQEKLSKAEIGGLGFLGGVSSQDMRRGRAFELLEVLEGVHDLIKLISDMLPRKPERNCGLSKGRQWDIRRPCDTR